MTALLGAFKTGVNHWFDKGQIIAEQRDDLIADADLIIQGITLLADEPIL